MDEKIQHRKDVYNRMVEDLDYTNEVMCQLTGEYELKVTAIKLITDPDDDCGIEVHTEHDNVITIIRFVDKKMEEL